MNVFGKAERSWRKARKRGVSPIIATILLVAITVVLAAVLYVLISGLTHGVGTTPIGSAFSAGNVVSGTCPTGYTLAVNGCLAGNQIYTLTVESSSVTFSSVLFSVKTTAGTIYPLVGAGGFSLVNTSSKAVAQTTFAASAGMAMGATFATYNAGATACNGGPCSGGTALQSVYIIYLDMGKSASSWTSGQGLSFVVTGTGGFSGTTTPVGLP